jgi:hypothetical protein
VRLLLLAPLCKKIPFLGEVPSFWKSASCDIAPLGERIHNNSYTFEGHAGEQTSSLQDSYESHRRRIRYQCHWDNGENTPESRFPRIGRDSGKKVGRQNRQHPRTDRRGRYLIVKEIALKIKRCSSCGLC